MSHKDALVLGLLLLCSVLGFLLWLEIRRRRLSQAGTGHRILLPFDEHTLSTPALDAALRIAKGDRATLVPVFLARVHLRVTLDAALPRQVDRAIPLLDQIELRASRLGVPVDSRIETGRTYRHALRRVIGQENFDRIVLAAKGKDGRGFESDDVAWALDYADTELLVLKPRSQPPDPPGR